MRLLAPVLLFTAAQGVLATEEESPESPPLTMAQVLENSQPSDWRPLDPENTLYMELPGGRVIIELAPDFAPRHVENIKALVRGGYFDGLAILRSQDNYVVQWGDPDGDDPEKARPVGETARATLPAEFTVPIPEGMPFTPMPDPDGYAPQTGFSNGFPAARDPKTNQTWLCHCYATVGVGRGNEPDSGGGTSLYAVIGHAPRHLDRNITVVGRVMQGMELLSILPRGTGPLGFYQSTAEMLPIKSVRVEADIPPAERANLETLRTDTATFRAVLESRRNRRDQWFKVPAGYLDVCNVPVIVRTRSDNAHAAR